MKLVRRRFDALIIGAGGAGLRAALQLARADANVAVVSKVFPTRSHTVAAQGGVNAALANVVEDNWHWHMFDTVKGSDYLGDQDAIEYMCRAAPQVVYELDHFGVPFSRLEDGNIYQRAFGGQSRNFGGEQAVRTCAAADRTGHAILHSLYQQNIRAKTHFFDEYFAVDLIKDADGYVLGALAFSIETGEPILIEAKATLLATGGAGQMYRTNTNALINTGDGLAQNGCERPDRVFSLILSMPPFTAIHRMLYYRLAGGGPGALLFVVSSPRRHARFVSKIPHPSAGLRHGPRRAAVLLRSAAATRADHPVRKDHH